MGRSRLLGIAAAILGVLLGVAGATSDAGTVAVIAGALALVAGVASVRLVELLRQARSHIEELDGRVGALQGDLEREARAREEAEQTLSSRMELTAVRRATEGDSLTDPVTGLYSEGWFTVALDATMHQARRALTPVAVVLLDVVEGLGDGNPKPADPRRVADGIASILREGDTACRLLDGGYALILEDTDDNGAVWTVERIRRHLATHEPPLTVWGGVACYPAHGLTVEEVLDRADLALDMAREWRQDRVEVATPVDS